MSKKLTRRSFVQTSAGAMALAANPFWSPLRAAAPESKNERPIIGSIGLGGQGTGIARRASEYGDVVAVCDVQRQHAERAKEKHFSQAEIYEDYRKLLDRDDIEAVTIGTPDHWHTAIALAALEAGKHVYCEKPLTLTIDEGKQLVAAVKKSGKVMQVGTQQRGDQPELFGRAVATARSGRLGKIKKVTVYLPLSTEEGGPFEAQSVPEGLNWDFWLGQAPRRTIVPSAAMPAFAGGMSTPAASPPTGARITWISHSGCSTWRTPGHCRSTERKRSCRPFPAGSTRRSWSRSTTSIPATCRCRCWRSRRATRVC